MALFFHLFICPYICSDVKLTVFSYMWNTKELQLVSLFSCLSVYPSFCLHVK